MKKINLLILSFVAVLIAACGDEDVMVGPNNLPANAVSYINEHRSDQSISLVIQDLDNDEPYCYEVELNNGEELYFDCAGNFLFALMDKDESISSETDDIILPASQIPDSVVSFINNEYPGLNICFVEMEDDNDEAYKYEVVLANGTEVYFDVNWNHLFTVLDNDYVCS